MILQISEVAAKLKLLHLTARQTVPTHQTIQQPYLLGCSRNPPLYLTRRSTALFTQPTRLLLHSEKKKIHYTPSYTFPLACAFFLSDEATFYVTRCVNRHISRIWGTQKPNEIHEYVLGSPKVNIWCGLLYDRGIGPFCFSEKTITGVSL